MTGTGTSYAVIALHSSYAMYGTVTASAALTLRGSYTVSGTAIAYVLAALIRSATRCPVLGKSTRCAVLRSHMRGQSVSVSRA
eukprot:1306280-Rhodomonas_salina.5